MKAVINLGPYGGLVEAEVDDIDLDAEEVLIDGQRLTEAKAEEIAREVARRHGLRGGRPRKPDADRASVQKAVRLTPEQAERLSEAARRAGVHEADILRQALESFLKSA